MSLQNSLQNARINGGSIFELVASPAWQYSNAAIFTPRMYTVVTRLLYTSY